MLTLQLTLQCRARIGLWSILEVFREGGCDRLERGQGRGVLEEVGLVRCDSLLEGASL